jgi:membrane protease YdiL (CAAX protease family)
MNHHANGFLRLAHRHPVAVYFVIAFAVSWTVVLAIALPSGFPGEGDALQKVMGPAFAGMVLGPLIGGLGLTALLEGTEGLRQLGRTLLAWRAAPAYYVAALLVVPACILFVLTALTVLVSPDFMPGTLIGGLPLVATGLAIGLAAGFLEEIGWTGFAMHRLLQGWSILRTGIVVGVLHAVWHLLAGYWGEGLAYGGWYVPYFLLCWVGGLTGLRVLVSWLYARTGSLPAAQLAHASYTGGLIILWPATTSPAQNVFWTALFAALLIAISTAVVAASRAVSTAFAPDHR